jgi:hypothetical protein
MPSQPCRRKKTGPVRRSWLSDVVGAIPRRSTPPPVVAPRRRSTVPEVVPLPPVVAPRRRSMVPEAVPETVPRPTVQATFVSHREQLTPAMVGLIDKIAMGREDQKDDLTCLVRNAWRPGMGPVLTPSYVAYRHEGITMITAVHSWAVACVGATNDTSPDRRDDMHRSKGLAASSLHDGMTPCWSIVESGMHVWSNAVAVLDKFLHAEGYHLKEGVLSDGARHKLLLCACACYVIAWKNHFSTFALLFDQVYECLLEYYTSTGKDPDDREEFTPVIVNQDKEYIALNPRDRVYVEKTAQGLSLEAAELFVLQVCGWGVGMSTITEAIDAILGTKFDTDPTMARLRILAYDNAMRTILDPNAIYSSEFFVLVAALGALSEAALVTEVPINRVLRSAD